MDEERRMRKGKRQSGRGRDGDTGREREGNMATEGKKEKWKEGRKEGVGNVK